MMKDRFIRPFLLNGVGDGRSLERLAYGAPPFTEAELQDVLRLHPALLAIDQIEPIYAPAICIGREVATAAGPLDNLYISPHGQITIVETKLWKNPQARREVVAQLMDYSKELAKRSYVDVEAVARRYVEKFHPDAGAPSLAEWVALMSGEQIDEQDFVESTSRCLKAGRFLLLIVGEGIRGSVEDLVEHMNQTPELRYNLNLVELGCYRLGNSDWPLVMVPHVIARTAEIERAVVRIELASSAASVVKVDVVTPQAFSEAESTGSSGGAVGGGGQRRIAPTEEEFLDRLRGKLGEAQTQRLIEFIDRLHGIGVYSKYKSASLSLRYQPRLEDAKYLSLLMIIDRGTMRTGSWMIDQLRESGLPEHLAIEFWARLRGIHPGLGLAAGKTTGYSEAIPIGDVIGKLPQIAEAIKELIAKVEASAEALS
jgi:hypothetical protein